MTRGTFIACLGRQKKGSKVLYHLLVSTEFNGDMCTNDPAGKGVSALNGLTNVSDETEFREFITFFNEENFGYEDELLFEVETERIKWNEIMEVFEDKSEELFDISSDYVFYINLSDAPMEVLSRDGVYKLLPQGIIVLNFGKVAKNQSGDPILYRAALTYSSVDWPDDDWRLFLFLDKLDEEDAKYFADHTNASEITGIWDDLYDYGYERAGTLGVEDWVLDNYFDLEKFAQDAVRDLEDVIELPSGKVVSYA